MDVDGTQAYRGLTGLCLGASSTGAESGPLLLLQQIGRQAPAHHHRVSRWVLWLWGLWSPLEQSEVPVTCRGVWSGLHAASVSGTS